MAENLPASSRRRISVKRTFLITTGLSLTALALVALLRPSPELGVPDFTDRATTPAYYRSAALLDRKGGPWVKNTEFVIEGRPWRESVSGLAARIKPMGFVRESSNAMPSWRRGREFVVQRLPRAEPTRGRIERVRGTGASERMRAATLGDLALGAARREIPARCGEPPRAAVNQRH